MSDDGTRAADDSPAGGAIEPLPTVSAEVSGAIPGPASEQIEPETPSIMPTAERYHGRFLATYIVLGVLLAAAIGAAVVMVNNSSSSAGFDVASADAWATWRPPSGTPEEQITAIQDKFSTGYQLNAQGAALDSVSHVFPPSINFLGSKVPLRTLTIRQVPGIETPGDQKIQATASNTVEYDLRGTVPLKSNANEALSGTKSLFRQRLLRRQAIQLGLYTLKYVPGIENVLVFMPGNQTKTTALDDAQAVMIFNKDNVAAQLAAPIYQMLPVDKPPLPTDPDSKEQAAIDALSSRVSYYYGLTSAGYEVLHAPEATDPNEYFDLTVDPWPGITPA